MNSKIESLKKRVDVLYEQSDYSLPAEELVINALTNEELDLIEIFRAEHKKLKIAGFSEIESIDMIEDRMGSESFDSALAVIEKAGRKYRYLCQEV